MGKPSSNLLVKSSSTSINLNLNLSAQKIQGPMSTHKMVNNKRKQHNKTKNRIKNLFCKLQKQSDMSFDNTPTTMMTLDTSDKGLTNENNVLTTELKRKNSELSVDSKRRKNDNSVILITDDDGPHNSLCTVQTPKTSKPQIGCSTPITFKDTRSLQNMIIKNFSNATNTENCTEVVNLTKEINKESYLTIDLTTDGVPNKTKNNTIIDVDKPDGTLQNADASVVSNADCSVVSISNADLSLSGESEITVLCNKSRRQDKDKNMNKFAKGISKLNSSEKGKLLEFIAKSIFTGCQMPTNPLYKMNITTSQGTETGQDVFIKEVILGETKSRNSVGSNIYHPSKDANNKKGLRMIVIDGSNVALEHTKGAMFSVKGLKICIDYFVKRGHVVKAFVPRFRCKHGKSSDPKLLDSLERQGLVVYTPSREIQGRFCVSYDDRYIVQCAAEFDGIIVSGDNYRDLLQENPRWRFVIENRLLPFTWVDDMIMFPRDPLGRNGPTLTDFLRHPAKVIPTIVL